MVMSWNGRSFTRLVLRSHYDQRITLNDVSSYLGCVFELLLRHRNRVDDLIPGGRLSADGSAARDWEAIG
jgi:hypothetical protein